jgi:hypothetical protein
MYASVFVAFTAMARPATADCRRPTRTQALNRAGARQTGLGVIVTAR